MSTPVYINPELATQVLDLFEEVVKASDNPMEIHFEELTADPGPLPRLMLHTRNSSTDNSTGYISGEYACPFPCLLTLRVAAQDEQDRLDADKYLRSITAAFLAKAAVLKDFIAYRKPSASMPYCLGRTSAFEDWQVTFELNYIQKP